MIMLFSLIFLVMMKNEKGQSFFTTCPPAYKEEEQLLNDLKMVL